jgi:iron complex outermembrane receptor protein
MAHLFDRRFEGNLPQYDFSGYSLVDAMLFYDEERLGRFTLAVSNLFDKQYITYFSQTSNNVNDSNFVAGRGRAITLRWQGSF